MEDCRKKRCGKESDVIEFRKVIVGIAMSIIYIDKELKKKITGT